jgi:hypothetical protein
MQMNPKTGEALCSEPRFAGPERVRYILGRAARSSPGAEPGALISRNLDVHCANGGTAERRGSFFDEELK